MGDGYHHGLFIGATFTGAAVLVGSLIFDLSGSTVAAFTTVVFWAAIFYHTR